jgi:hypothetical protein
MASGMDAETARTACAVERAKVRRLDVINQIKSIHSLALRVEQEPELGPNLTNLVIELDSLWTQFRFENDPVLDGLTDLDRFSEYDGTLMAGLRTCMSECMVVAAKLVPKGAEVIDSSYLQAKLGPPGRLEHPTPNESAKPSSWLPEIPLPEFDGDIRLWPTFRNRFRSLIDARLSISNIDKMYYLIGCLTGEAADAIRGIPVSADNYALAWSLLSERFYRPRLVATSLIDKLLNSTNMSQELLSDLNNFPSTVNEAISLLEALDVPNIFMGSFILFTIAFKRLPVATRKLFESCSTADYPSIKVCPHARVYFRSCRRLA